MRSKKELVEKIVSLVSDGYEYPEAEDKALQSFTAQPPSGSELVRLYDEEVARQDESFAEQCRLESKYGWAPRPA